MAKERLQKLLAQAGVASRRAAEALIEAGRVRVNGRVVRELGTRADLHHDRVEVDGRRLVAERPVYYLVNKPREMVTTLHDPEGRSTLGALVKRIPERVFPVGRLDYHTSGALLVTNDGEMADALLHPAKGVPKTYIAKMKGVVEEKALQSLRNGVVLDDGYKTAKAEVFVAREERRNSWLSITIREGKNRQIHRMGDAVGHRVMRLSRTEFAGLSVEGLPPGTLRPLRSREVDKLKKDYLNPRKRQKQNQARARAASENAEFFAGWGEDVVSTPAPSPTESGAKRGRPAKRTASETTAQRAVRALSRARAPKERSIGGKRSGEAAPTKRSAPSPSSTKRAPTKRSAPSPSSTKRAPTKRSAPSPSSTKRASTKRSAPSPSSTKKRSARSAPAKVTNRAAKRAAGRPAGSSPSKRRAPKPPSGRRR